MTKASKDPQLAARYQVYLICALLIAVTLAAFWPMLHNGFVNYDDDVYVTENPHVQSGLTAESLSWAFTTNTATNWHPVTWIGHIANCSLYGLNPIGHHLTSLLLHLANMLLLFVVLTRLRLSHWQAAMIAALFAIHPLHVESVAWAAELKDVLSTCFWMLAMLAYVWYANRPGIGRYVILCLAFALGLMAKPMLVSLPIVLLILDYWPLQRTQSWRQLVMEKLPLFALSAVCCVITYCVQKGAVRSHLGHVPLAIRLDNALVSCVAYLCKTVWPARLAVMYPHPMRSLPVWEIIGSGLALALISIAAVRARKRRPYVLAGWLWYLVTLLPVIGLVQVGEQGMADRYTYVPLVGIFLIVVRGAWELAGKWADVRGIRVAGAVVAAGVILILAGCTRAQIGCWRDGRSLFSHALEVTSGNYVAHLNLGVALDSECNYPEAERQYQAALRLWPDWPEALYDHGNLLSKLGRYDEAVRDYRKALEARPSDASVHYNLGRAYNKQNKPRDALSEYQAAVKLQPGYVEARNNLAVGLYRAGRYAESWEQVDALRKLGFEPHPGFIAALSSKAPRSNTGN